MQTLISAFDDRNKARKAVERLVNAGFARADVHLQEAPGPAPCADESRTTAAADAAINQSIGDKTMQSAEREVAVDRGVMESIGHFFVSLFGQDDVERRADRYTGAMRRGHSVIVVDARTDEEAENAAVVLHDSGAVDVDDRNVHRYAREGQPAIREIIGSRQAGIENDIDQRQGELAKAAGRATVERERAVAANDPVSGDRPGYRE